MQNVKSTCRYVGDDPIEMSLAIDMALGKGPKATGDFKDVKYFISVTPVSYTHLDVYKRQDLSLKIRIKIGAPNFTPSSAKANSNRPELRDTASRPILPISI